MQRLQAPGRLFFIQDRTGYGQNSFRILKFRSMYEKREKRDESVQVRKGDQRIYPFGRFLRSYSIDEFPQFLNVVKGEMSIVGPRPHMVAHDQEFSRRLKGYRTRFFVRPGITGLAQCNGFRGEIDHSEALEKRIALDVEYIAHWSIWLDIQVVAKTAWHLFFPQATAY
jgi:lipopolysaccharide/colanic/teichoic acid biosynthesis glycosyltransferase